MTSSRKIAFQGEPGANSHIACRQAYPDLEPLPCPTFEDAFAAVSDGEAALGMIPIENSLAGRVADIHHHLMPTAGLSIVGEWFLPIRHQLMAPKGARRWTKFWTWGDDAAWDNEGEPIKGSCGVICRC